MMTVDELTSLLRPVRSRIASPEASFSVLLTDSRKLTHPSDTLFFAIRTKRNNGARYIGDLYNKGVRSFVVCDDMEEELDAQLMGFSEANYLYVSDVIAALQRLAAYRRSLYDIPVVGITGSNGKTIVKDWIVQLLAIDHHVVANPKSYNSQIGVPLSVWQMGPEHDMAVFEAGISEAGKMEALKDVIRPSIGIFTNIGQAHDENFLTRYQKIAEKLLLFTHCEVLIYCADHKDIHSVVSEKESLRRLNRFTWGRSEDNSVQLLDTQVHDHSSVLKVMYNGIGYDVEIPFVDRASQENAMHCVALLFYLGYEGDEIVSRCSHLAPVAMRLEMNEGINNCLLINDSYSLDLNSLSIALDFVQHEHQHFRKTLVISDFVQSGVPEPELYSQVADLARLRGISKVVGIGEALIRNRDCFNDTTTFFYHDTDDFLQHHPFADFQNETILIKGARIFSFEQIAKALQRKSHETIMEVNLDALVQNVNYYRSLIKPSTKLMAMVKASSYGAGKVEVANTLQYNHVDYLTVAYCDEGVELRHNGIQLPIMVMNPEEESFDSIVRYDLEPDIYSFRILELFSEAARLYTNGERRIAIHIELDTGMHRLGFSPDDIPELARRLNADDSPVRVVSIFSHLACSEDGADDDFTRSQIARFREGSSRLKKELGDNRILCHILNSSGITRFPEAQMDMVRLGLGLYGIAPQPEIQQHLAMVSTLKTRISQLKSIPKDESVGYNRRWIAARDSVIAIIPIGYADGLSRHLGYGHGHVVISGQRAPIIGSVCMDMCFVDVTGIDCHEGDEVILFGTPEQLCELAEAAGTISYELLTSVSPRVKRIYVSND